MVYVTGDIHGDRDIHKLTQTSQKHLAYKTGQTTQMPGKGDYLIICGDFGLVWYEEHEAGYKRQKYWLDWLTKQPYTTLFVDGNHENFPLLSEYPTVKWHGGLVQKITPKIYHLMRGCVYNIEGSTFFTFGGASSHDKEYRVAGYTWWPEELPTTTEIEYAEQSLNKCAYKVNYVITHCCTQAVQANIKPTYPTDILTEFFDKLDEKLTYTRWFNGHYHVDTDMQKHIVLYHRILPIPTEKNPHIMLL